MDTIRVNCSNINDIYGYCENKLLFDVEGASIFYGVTTNDYVRAVDYAASEVVKCNQ